jgi:GNAT superfamily N-acetyltransferase
MGVTVSIEIKVKYHGESDLWVALGPFLTSRDVNKDLGGPIYSSEGVTWLIAYDGAQVVGFCSLRVVSGVAWHDYDYVVPSYRGKGVFSSLASARSEIEKGLPLRAVIRESRWANYETRGWAIKSRRGSWLTVSKEAV